MLRSSINFFIDSSLFPFQSPTSECPSRKRSDTSTNCSPEWTTCTPGELPTGTWSRRICSWTSTTTSRSPTLAWPPCSGSRYTSVSREREPAIRWKILMSLTCRFSFFFLVFPSIQNERPGAVAGQKMRHPAVRGPGGVAETLSGHPCRPLVLRDHPSHDAGRR